MGDVNQARLRDQLVENYGGLITKLTRRLGSSDFAHEALHETFLRLDRVTEAEPVRSPNDYLFRIAINVAKDRHRAQNYRVGVSDVEAILDICDDQPDATRVVEARSEIAALKRALAELPERPRRVLEGISIEGRTAHDVADHLRVSLRTVENDLRLALRHCAAALGRTVVRRSGGPRLRP
ncbi:MULTISPECIES: RNA polymerase sigma factor [Bradyrhizobium]|uniref:RNA polymerase sigma factor n=1 Tax=Bradyrhizobium TaxID=374 RepID=UPI0004236BDA|nr:MULTISPECIES: RNA polymerase sigma factor [Bradyrhizobium]KIU44863.1 FecI sigma-24 factor [Bradyrhizobium elkanii]MBK5650807.1 RNA polymerase sigma factor [Rhizobium sp.]OCX26623.1 RNA polymerase subunit sigma-24 [Bradyrhizobium sp. UASWS1016]